MSALTRSQKVAIARSLLIPPAVQMITIVSAVAWFSPDWYSDIVKASFVVTAIGGYSFLFRDFRRDAIAVALGYSLMIIVLLGIITFIGTVWFRGI